MKVLGHIDEKALAESKVLDQDGKQVVLGTFYQKAALVIFVRHFGCIGCTMQMQALAPRLQEFDLLGIPTIIVGNGEPRYIEGFIERFQLQNQPLKIVTDPSLGIFKIAKLKKSFWATYGPRALWDNVKAFTLGVIQKTYEGNLFQQGGTILLNREGKVVFYHQNDHISDLSDLSDVVDEIHKMLALENQEYV